MMTMPMMVTMKVTTMVVMINTLMMMKTVVLT